MGQYTSFSVATLGFDERERAMLRDLLRLSEHRTPTFRVYSHADGPLPHILMVNAVRAEVIAKWRAFRKVHAGRYTCSDVLISMQPIATRAKHYAAVRPVAVSQLFSLLDRAVIDDHGYRPAPATWRPPFVLSSQEHALFRTPAPRPAPSTVERAAPRHTVASRPSARTEEIAVVMEPTDSNASTISARTIQEAVLAARITELAERGRPVSAAKARILIVDDSLQARMQLKTALEAFATSIDFADTGEHAQRLLERYKYDLIFLDVILPGQSGFEICRFIRRHPRQRSTPVVMVTSNDSAAERAAGEKAGCDAYLIKPVRQTVLTEVISAYVTARAA